MTLDRRTLLRAALVAATGAAVGQVAAGCDGERQPAARESAAGSSGSASRASSAPAATSTTSAAAAAPSPTKPAAAATSASHPGGPAVEIVHGPASATGVALTFHGAGDPALAVRLLSEVEAAGAHVTVLAVGSWLEQQPQMAKRILDAGHELGNHTYSHLTMPRLSATVDDSEITRCADVLRRLTGSPGRWFRPSGTVHATPAILAAAGRSGYSTCLSYDVDPSDYADPGASAVTSRVLAAVRPGSIVSLHLGHFGTVQAMPAILDGLRSRSLPAVTMSTLMGTGVAG